MTYIRTIAPEQAEGKVRALYDQVSQQLGHVPNWALAFSLRPEVRDGWNALLTSIRPNLSLRTYELATLAAARALRSSYCALAHGKVLAEQVFDPATVAAIAADSNDTRLTDAERAMMAFVEKLVIAADRIGAADVDRLREHGYTDENIFDIAAAAAARCFFSKLLDALGVRPDAHFQRMDAGLRQALVRGRPIADG